MNPLQKTTIRKPGNFLLIYLTLGVLATLGITQLFLTNYLTAFGNRLAGAQEEITQLTEENDLLEVRLGGLASLSRVSQESQAFGLSQPEKVVFFTPTSVALRLP